MQTAATLRVFFGHQSVGANLLDGARQAGGARLRVHLVPVVGRSALAEPGIGHLFLGENEQPDTKFAAFEAALQALDGQVDVALFKLCYVDISAATDAEALFSRYAALMDRLKAQHPGVTVAHVTVPLTVVQGGVKAWVKKRLGRGAWGERENVKRHAFNELLRQRYAADPVFDLAKLEATRADGTLETYEVDGKTVPRLRGDFTDDGGHLNAAGRAALGRAFVEFLGAVKRP